MNLLPDCAHWIIVEKPHELAEILLDIDFDDG
jgi:hypothetical protein